MLIDTHTHLDDARYNEDREAVITRARNAGIEAFLTIGCDLATSQAAVALSERYPFIYASIGIHPHEAKHVRDTWYDTFRDLARNMKVVAYGEIGLDYHYNHSPPKDQRDRFREQIQVARELTAAGDHSHEGGTGGYGYNSEGRESVRDWWGISLFFRR